MRLNAPYGDLIPHITKCCDSKVTVYKRLTDIVSVILAGLLSPKPDVDYAGLAAEMLALRARLDFIDHTLLRDSALVVFITLVDAKRDSQNQVSHIDYH